MHFKTKWIVCFVGDFFYTSLHWESFPTSFEASGLKPSKSYLFQLHINICTPTPLSTKDHTSTALSSLPPSNQSAQEVILITCILISSIWSWRNALRSLDSLSSSSQWASWEEWKRIVLQQRQIYVDQYSSLTDRTIIMVRYQTVVYIMSCGKYSQSWPWCRKADVKSRVLHPTCSSYAANMSHSLCWPLYFLWHGIK